MQLPVYSQSGEVVKQIEVSDRLFGEPFNEAVVHQVMVAQRANLRQGTASTKTRGEVRGSSKKLFRQKGTGSARAGSRKSPLRRGGGVTFGPHPRDYRQALPKKMRRLALRCVLSAKAGSEGIRVLETLDFTETKTRYMVELLSTLGVAGSILVVTAETAQGVVRSGRNIPGVKTLPVAILNVLDLLSHSTLLITEDAVRRAERIWTKVEANGGDNASV